MMIQRVSGGPKLFQAGGFDSTQFVGYDIPAGTWDSAGTETQPGFPSSLHDYCMETVNGVIYVIGGQAASVQSTVYRYDIASNTWLSHGTAIPTAVTEAQSCVVGAKIYVICGNQAPTDVFKVQIYDTAADSWSTGTDLTESISQGVCDAISGTIYLASGIRNGATVTNHCWAYDPTGATWTAKANMPTGKAYARGKARAGSLYVCGGENGFTNSPTTTVQAYDPSANTWSTLTGSPMPAARMLHAAYVSGGLLYIFGGTTNGGTAGKQATLWSFDGSTWTTLTSAPAADYGCGIAAT